MKNRGIRILIGCIATLMLTACPYQSSVPVTLPEESVDKELLGEWVSSSELEFTNPNYYKVDKHSDYKYKITENRYNAVDSIYKEKVYLMHTSTVNDKRFVNIQAETGGNYFIYLLQLQDKGLALTEVTDNIDEQFSSSKDLEDFVKKYMHLSFFYAKSEDKFFKRTE